MCVSCLRDEYFFIVRDFEFKVTLRLLHCWYAKHGNCILKSVQDTSAVLEDSNILFNYCCNFFPSNMMNSSGNNILIKKMDIKKDWTCQQYPGCVLVFLFVCDQVLVPLCYYLFCVEIELESSLFGKSTVRSIGFVLKKKMQGAFV